MADCVREDGSDVLVRVKAVPGASRDQISGLLGDRLKIRVSAPPEGGKANKAIARVLRSALGISGDRVELVRGASGAQKLWRLRGMGIKEVREALGIEG